MKSNLPATTHTSLYTLLWMVKLQVVEDEVEVVVNTRASTLVVGKHLALKLGLWKQQGRLRLGKEIKVFWWVMIL